MAICQSLAREGKAGRLWLSRGGDRYPCEMFFILLGHFLCAFFNYEFLKYISLMRCIVTRASLKKLGSTCRSGAKRRENLKKCYKINAVYIAEKYIPCPQINQRDDLKQKINALIRERNARLGDVLSVTLKSPSFASPPIHTFEKKLAKNMILVS